MSKLGGLGLRREQRGGYPLLVTTLRGSGDAYFVAYNSRRVTSIVSPRGQTSVSSLKHRQKRTFLNFWDRLHQSWRPTPIAIVVRSEILRNFFWLLWQFGPTLDFRSFLSLSFSLFFPFFSLLFSPSSRPHFSLLRPHFSGGDQQSVSLLVTLLYNRLLFCVGSQFYTASYKNIHGREASREGPACHSQKTLK